LRYSAILDVKKFARLLASDFLANTMSSAWTKARVTAMEEVLVDFLPSEIVAEITALATPKVPPQVVMLLLADDRQLGLRRYSAEMRQWMLVWWGGLLPSVLL
jgi:hypothetical protein